MTAISTTSPKAPPVPRNGVDTPALFATINAVAQQPELAKFRFRATTRWVKGAHSRTTIDSFSGAGSEHVHKQQHSYDADHPPVLVGTDNGPIPVEFVLQALGACLMAGIASVAAARRVDLHEVVAKIEGRCDLRGVLGLSADVRNGYVSREAAERLSALLSDSDPAAGEFVDANGGALSPLFDAAG
jgi:uncharacterized OsmC-like protein